MPRKLVAAVAALTDEQRRRIAGAAEANGFIVEFYPDGAAARPHAGEAEILLTNDAELAKHAPSLRWYSSSNAGVDPLLKPDAFASPDAVLTNSSGAYGVTISEHIIMMTLELMRRQPEYSAIVARREWRRDLKVRSIHGSRVTLLGTGDIGSETVRRLRGFCPAGVTGVNRRGANPGGLYDRIVTIDRLDEVLPETDLLIVSLPGTPETTGLLDARRLALLPDGAFLINVGRGNVLDEAALIRELGSGRLAGAGLDVFAHEPLPVDDPLWSCPGLLITPHTAGNVSLDYTVERIVDMFLENFARYCAGEPLLHVVDRAIGY